MNKIKPEDVPKLCTWDKDKEEWHCNKCGSVIMRHIQIVSLHMKGMPLAGFGETIKKEIPYCPKCEGKPSDIGIAYYGSEDDPDVQDMRKIKKLGDTL